MITAVALAKHFTLPCVLEQDFSDCGTVCYPFICVSACALSVFTCCTRALLRIPAIHFRIWPFYGGQLACPKVLGAIIFMIITVYALTLVSVHSLGDSPGFICLISPVPSQQHQGCFFCVCLSLSFISRVSILIHSPAHSLFHSVFHNSFLGKWGAENRYHVSSVLSEQPPHT